ncbi:MAG TPA: (2Fe-2S)-binding protein, partial [Candidatus Aminicenantes bacterium]|nr:(2Fe-2S)-binding protein [Candidatus Aminicenantes bacterium]
MKETIRFEINGRPVSLDVDSDRMLLWILRDELGLTGTKYGCGEGVCGACVVHEAGQALRACIVNAAAAE